MPYRTAVRGAVAVTHLLRSSASIICLCFSLSARVASLPASFNSASRLVSIGFQEVAASAVGGALAGAGMLSQAPSTLRKIKIYLDSLNCLAMLNDQQLLRLQAFEEVITPARFPLVEEVNVRIIFSWFWEMFVDRKVMRDVVLETRKALPGLHARGLLRVSCIIL